MLEIKSLENYDINYLVDVFLEAFSDYTTSFTRGQMLSNLRRRGFKAEYSYGVFDNDRLVSFVFNGVRVYADRLTAYDTGTGTLKEYRRKGLTNRLLQHAERGLRESGVEGYLLEVLCDNAPAVSLYKKMGFETVRTFTCLRQSVADVSIPCVCSEEVSIKKLAPSDIAQNFDSFCDECTSWQNSIESMIADEDTIDGFGAIVDGETVGYIAGDTAQGDIMGIAVRLDMRRRGIGILLLKTFLETNKTSHIKVLNIDNRCTSLLNFLSNRNIPVSVCQYEMYKNFS